MMKPQVLEKLFSELKKYQASLCLFLPTVNNTVLANFTVQMRN